MMLVVARRFIIRSGDGVNVLSPLSFRGCDAFLQLDYWPLGRR